MVLYIIFIESHKFEDMNFIILKCKFDFKLYTDGNLLATKRCQSPSSAFNNQAMNDETV